MGTTTEPAVAAAAAAASSHPVAYQALRVFTNGSSIAIQPKDRPVGATTAAPVETLSIDLNTGSVQVVSKPLFPGQGTVILGVLGLSRLHKGFALLVITAAQRVATVQGCDVFRVAAAEVMAGAPASGHSSENRKLIRLLAHAVDPKGAGRDMFFSYTYDVTLSAQRLAAVLADPAAASRPLAARADSRFTWNRSLLQPLVDGGAARFCMPAIVGFVRQLPGLSFVRPGRPSAGTATLTLFARRSPNRAGTRHWRRGADVEGNAANYVETEQLLTLDSAAASLSSFVEIRGSIPLLWTQLPNMKYKPPTVMAPRADSAIAFDRHFKSLVEQYKKVVVINLVNSHGSEGKLADAFRVESERFIASVSSGLRYVAFDFHAECGEKRYHRLSILWDQVTADFTAHGFFLMEKGKVVRRQEGVMRINCIDCLDRTNVIQSVYGRKALEMVLRHFDLLPPSGTLPETFPQVEQKFKVLWADHGDQVSTQYAGTGAMKSGFTRTGKRTFGGKLDDGVKALTRYYLNNFQDGKKQDLVDFFTGHYTVDPKGALPIRSQPSPLFPILLALLAFAYALRAAGRLLLPAAGRAAAAAAAATLAACGADEDRTCAARLGVAGTAHAGGDGVMQLLEALLRGVVVPLIVALVLMMLVSANGKFLVNVPQLCPKLAYTVTKPAGGVAGAKVISIGKALPPSGPSPLNAR